MTLDQTYVMSTFMDGALGLCGELRTVQRVPYTGPHQGSFEAEADEHMFSCVNGCITVDFDDVVTRDLLGASACTAHECLISGLYVPIDEVLPWAYVCVYNAISGQFFLLAARYTGLNAYTGELDQLHHLRVDSLVGVSGCVLTRYTLHVQGCTEACATRVARKRELLPCPFKALGEEECAWDTTGMMAKEDLGTPLTLETAKTSAAKRMIRLMAMTLDTRFGVKCGSPCTSAS